MRLLLLGLLFVILSIAMILHDRGVAHSFVEVVSLHRGTVRVLSADGRHGLQMTVRVDPVITS